MALNWDRETSVGALGAMKSRRVPRFRAICTRSLVNCRFEPHAKITRLAPDARSAASPTRQVPLSPLSATSRLPAAGTSVATCVPFISVAERGSQKPAIGPSTGSGVPPSSQVGGEQRAGPSGAHVLVSSRPWRSVRSLPPVHV